MTEAIVKHEAMGQLAERVRLTKQGLEVEKQQRRLLNEFVRECMTAGTDFGVIPGTDKPTLLKPGAEKLVDLFRCTPEFILEKDVTDFEAGMFYYRFKVRIFSEAAGRVLAEGVGSANSREGRYRWRNGGRKCPKCQKETIIPGKEEYGGGWLCFAKKGGCGGKYKKGDASIEGQQVGRIENEDIADLDNTILKMAKKRALVDGAIALARCSDLFTQDMEDLGYEPAPPPTVERPPKDASPAYGPPVGPEVDREAMERDFKAAREQVTGRPVEPTEEETHVITGTQKGKAIGSLDAVALQQAIEEIGKVANDPAAKAKRSYPKAARSYAALCAERDLRRVPAAEQAEILSKEEAST